MRFLVDMPLSPGLARWLIAQGHDAIHASELGLSQAPDTEIIERARIDLRTVRGGEWSDQQVIDRMRSILTSVRPDDLVRSILVVDRNRVRRRNLPIESI